MATGSIRERNGRFYVRTRVLAVDPATGRPRWRQVEKAAGSTRHEAQASLRALQSEVAEGRFLPSSMTVAELGYKWLSEHVQPNLKPGAAANYAGTFYRHIVPTLGAKRLDDCTPHLIRAVLGKKRAEGLAGETVAKIRRHIHAMFAFARDEGLLSVNPADGARARGRRLSGRGTRGTELTPVQIRRFLDECSPRWQLFFTVALDTGLRRGEMVGLCWGDVDLLQRIIYVRRSIGAYDKPDLLGVAGDELLTTKTEAGERLVPILDSAQATLEALYKTAVDTSDRAPVFATLEPRRGTDGVLRPAGRPLSPRMVTRVFRRYAERAALPSSIRLHDLRHTAITNAIGQGEDILLISAFAGHAKTSTTVDVYGHLMPDRVTEAARRMRSVSGPVSGAEVAATAPPVQASPSVTQPAPGELGAPNPMRATSVRVEYALTERETTTPIGGVLRIACDRRPGESARVTRHGSTRRSEAPGI